MSAMVSAQPVRRHLELLSLRGVSAAEVARRTGYSRAALSYITHRAQRVRRETAEDIFTIRIPAPADLSDMPAAGGGIVPMRRTA